MVAEQAAGGCPFLARRLAHHPELRAELTAARALGISHRRFLGWEPTKVTTVERDSHRRIAQYVTTTEPEWDDDQQGLMLALAEYEAGICPGCGLPLEETTADVIGPDGKVDPVASMAQYEATPHSRCYSCTAKGEAEEAGRQRIQPHAIRWQIKRR